ncbi:triglyceride lipase-cholesterol esterase [Mitosporidium daphniae]|uniref:Triglyceride lipase-cholesterol esterase n=1 Tax=Mitosporidium daphniae TaxID=1485682 RepID=A0A098VTN8_9MICR|nr:triglyceride lipase-cholesterol esterase [Mitosporidium daphniae]KGG52199.1 triglyceride lipase-cholesterol esterase [Mitosporidium daphniae]|eukprot:XP_013238626.1 triglyceride lipase-cholesterol esterase [Mitosporidium daphniae]
MPIPIISRVCVCDLVNVIFAFYLLLGELLLRILLSWIPDFVLAFLSFGPSDADKKTNPTNFVEFVERCEGYAAEEHLCLTDDGFILTLHRIRKSGFSSIIPGNEPATFSKPSPILLMHGCMMSSDVWVCTPLKSLSYAFILLDMGYCDTDFYRPHVVMTFGWETFGATNTRPSTCD